MHEFGSNPKTRMLPVALSVPFHYIRYRFFSIPHLMNPKNTIKGLIPQRLLVLVPPADRDKWADRIVEKFKVQNPECYAAIQKERNKQLQESEAQEYAARYHAQEQERRIRDAQTQSARKNIVIIAIIWLFVMAICFSAFAFREQFKHQFGMTPTEYRQNL